MQDPQSRQRKSVTLSPAGDDGASPLGAYPLHIHYLYSQRSDIMNLKQITPSTISLIVPTIMLLAVGTYTDNSGFQLAGGILLIVMLIIAFNQARKRDISD